MLSHAQTCTSHVSFNRVTVVMVSSHRDSDCSAEGESGVISSHESHHDGEDDDDDKSRLMVDEHY